MKKEHNLRIVVVISLLLSIVTYSQSSSVIAGTERSDTPPKPDYRRHLNIPEYDSRLMPLDYNNKTTGVWTELNPRIPRVDYTGVDFIDSLTGWSVGSNGAIIKTTDGGKNWVTIFSPVTKTLLKVSSYNGNTVVITGYDGVILLSTNGGEVFEQVESGVGDEIDLWGVQMMNDTTGWVCGMNGTLLKTTNGGLTWLSIPTGLSIHYWWLEFLNEHLGFIACEEGKILKTTDGGNNWVQIQVGDSRALYTIDVIDSLHIIAAGVGGKNNYSSDGGNTWVQNNDLIFSSVNCISFVNVDTGYAIGEDWGIRKTEDRGVTWYASNVNLGEWHIKLLKDKTGYIVGSGLKIYKTINGYDNWKRLINNDYFYDICFLTEMKGFAISGRLYLTTDGGNNWEETSGPAGYVITFTDTLNGYIGTSYATPYGHSVFTIYKTSDGGASWFNTVLTGEVDSSARIQKIFFINKNTGWAVTSNGGIIKTTDSGNSWFVQLNTYSYIFFSGIHFTDSLNGWTANFNNRPMKTSNSGNTWINQQQINLTQTEDVYFKDINTGWLIESSGLYKTTNEGMNWTKIQGVSGNLRSFRHFKEEGHWFIIGGARYETTNGGDTWIDITNNSPSINSLHSPTSGVGYACGEMGLLVKYVDSSFVPVELSDFQVEQNGNNIVLRWKTITETNSIGFEIERENANGDWARIGFIKGKGTSIGITEYSYIDENPLNGINIYRLKQIDFDGTIKYYLSKEVSFNLNIEYKLYQNYPNPFNPVTNIKFDLPFESEVRLVIINTLGEIVEIIENNKRLKGSYEVQWGNKNYPSGVYLLILNANSLENERSFQEVRKLLLIK